MSSNDPSTTPAPASSLGDIRAFLSDMDGTLYVSSKLIPGAVEFVSKVRDRGYPLLFLTNNSSARAVTFRDRLRNIGIPAENEEILTSGEASARWLRDHTDHRHIYLLGTPALYEEFEEFGFTFAADDAKEADAVVMGFDRTLTYARLERTCLLVTNGVPYYATHPDATCITTRGLIPDVGSFIEAIDLVSHRRPKILGKPMPEMAVAALAKLGASASHTAMVGDQLDTDISMANSAGLYGILMLSGETSRERLEAQSEVTPDLICDSVADLVDALD